jgi:hypothetical protein
LSTQSGRFVPYPEPRLREDEGGCLDGDADDPLDEALDDPLLDWPRFRSRLRNGSTTGPVRNRARSKPSNTFVPPHPLQRYALR